MKTGYFALDDKGSTLKIESFYHIVSGQSDGTWTFLRHRHSDFLEISLVVKGNGQFEYGHERFQVCAQDLIVKNAGCSHGESFEAEPFEQYCLGISGFQTENLAENTMIAPDRSPVIHTGEVYDYLRASMQYLYTLCSSNENEELCSRILENILFVIRSLCQNEKKFLQQSCYSELVMDVMDYIDASYNEPLSLDTISRSFYVSSCYLSHKFKEETGNTVLQYIQENRLGQAQYLLVFSDLPIKTVAARCGFSNIQYFYSVFKKFAGCTPSDIRTRYNSIWAKS